MLVENKEENDVVFFNFKFLMEEKVIFSYIRRKQKINGVYVFMFGFLGIQWINKFNF